MGDGPQGIRTPTKLRHLQQTLYRRLEVVDPDLSKYFDSIPQDRLIRMVARRTSDGSMPHPLRAWMDAPVVEEQDGQRRDWPNRQGVPQGGRAHAVNRDCGSTCGLTSTTGTSGNASPTRSVA